MFNQSLMGMLARLAAPGQPNKVVWLLLALLVAGYGIWRAARASRAGDELVGLTLTGLVGSLISPVTWAHHIFWFVPAIVVLLDAARPVWAAVVYATVTFSLLSLWDFTLHKPGGPVGFLLSNWLVWLMLVLLPALPIRPARTEALDHGE